MNDFHICAVDTINHPGKSAEVSLSARNYDYGKWAGEVIDTLGYESICCFGGSFGAGILAKTMCAAPEKVKRAVLHVPAGIKNAPAKRVLPREEQIIENVTTYLLVGRGHMSSLTESEKQMIIEFLKTE